MLVRLLLVRLLGWRSRCSVAYPTHVMNVTRVLYMQLGPTAHLLCFITCSHLRIIHQVSIGPCSVQRSVLLCAASNQGGSPLLPNVALNGEFATPRVSKSLRMRKARTSTKTKLEKLVPSSCSA